jgi:hypothetical protein
MRIQEQAEEDVRSLKEQVKLTKAQSKWVIEWAARIRADAKLEGMELGMLLIEGENESGSTTS